MSKSQIEVYTCKYCQDVFNTDNKKKKHTAKAHSNQLELNKANRIQRADELGLMCKPCGKKFTDESNLYKHIRNCQQVPPEERTRGAKEEAKKAAKGQEKKEERKPRKKKNAPANTNDFIVEEVAQEHLKNEQELFADKIKEMPKLGSDVKASPNRKKFKSSPKINTNTKPKYKKIIVSSGDTLVNTSAAVEVPIDEEIKMEDVVVAVEPVQTENVLEIALDDDHVIVISEPEVPPTDIPMQMIIEQPIIVQEVKKEEKEKEQERPTIEIPSVKPIFELLIKTAEADEAIVLPSYSDEPVLYQADVIDSIDEDVKMEDEEVIIRNYSVPDSSLIEEVKEDQAELQGSDDEEYNAYYLSLYENTMRSSIVEVDEIVHKQGKPVPKKGKRVTKRKNAPQFNYSHSSRSVSECLSSQQSYGSEQSSSSSDQRAGAILKSRYSKKDRKIPVEQVFLDEMRQKKRVSRWQKQQGPWYKDDEVFKRKGRKGITQPMKSNTSKQLTIDMIDISVEQTRFDEIRQKRCDIIMQRHRYLWCDNDKVFKRKKASQRKQNKGVPYQPKPEQQQQHQIARHIQSTQSEIKDEAGPDEGESLIKGQEWLLKIQPFQQYKPATYKYIPQKKEVKLTDFTNEEIVKLEKAWERLSLFDRSNIMMHYPQTYLHSSVQGEYFKRGKEFEQQDIIRQMTSMQIDRIQNGRRSKQMKQQDVQKQKKNIRAFSPITTNNNDLDDEDQVMKIEEIESNQVEEIASQIGYWSQRLLDIPYSPDLAKDVDIDKHESERIKLQKEWIAELRGSDLDNIKQVQRVLKQNRPSVKNSPPSKRCDIIDIRQHMEEGQINCNQITKDLGQMSLRQSVPANARKVCHASKPKRMNKKDEQTKPREESPQIKEQYSRQETLPQQQQQQQEPTYNFLESIRAKMNIQVKESPLKDKDAEILRSALKMTHPQSVPNLSRHRVSSQQSSYKTIVQSQMSSITQTQKNSYAKKRASKAAVKNEQTAKKNHKITQWFSSSSKKAQQDVFTEEELRLKSALGQLFSRRISYPEDEVKAEEFATTQIEEEVKEEIIPVDVAEEIKQHHLQEYTSCNTAATMATNTSSMPLLTVNGYKCTLPKETFDCLEGTRYLTNTIINDYLQMLKKWIVQRPPAEERKKILVMSPEFYGFLSDRTYGLEKKVINHADAAQAVKQAIKRQWPISTVAKPSIILDGLLSYDFIIIPILDVGRKHWLLMVIEVTVKKQLKIALFNPWRELCATHTNKELLHYNSKANDFFYSQPVCNFMNYLKTEQCLEQDLVRQILNNQVVVQQDNKYDCGVFMLFYINEIVIHGNLDVLNSNVMTSTLNIPSQVRRQMIQKSLMQGKLVDIEMTLENQRKDALKRSASQMNQDKGDIKQEIKGSKRQRSNESAEGLLLEQQVFPSRDQKLIK